MKYFVHILSILILVIGFSSCQKAETEGFEESEVSLQTKSQPTLEETDKEGDKPLKLYRGEEPDAEDTDEDDEDNITDDEDDEDEDENNPSANR